MSVWSALSGAVAIRPMPEGRRVVDEFNSFGVALQAELDDHDNGTAVVTFRGGDFVSQTTANMSKDKALELVPFLTAPAHLAVDRDGEPDVIALSDLGNRTRLTLTLVDGAERATGTLKVVLECEGSCLEARPRGDGDGDDEAEAEDGHGAPVLIERHGGRLRLIIAPDINSPDRQIVDLEAAREARRTRSASRRPSADESDPFAARGRGAR